MEHPEKNDDKRILEETVKGIIPAVAVTEKGSPVQCGLVFATNVMIVAFFKSKIANIAGALRSPDYHIMKRAWAKYENKPTAPILSEYRCYVIPYSEITHFGALEKGRIRKRSILSVFTPQQRFTFIVNTSKRTLEPDVSLFLDRVGIRFSKGDTD